MGVLHGTGSSAVPLGTAHVPCLLTMTQRRTDMGQKNNKAHSPSHPADFLTQPDLPSRSGAKIRLSIVFWRQNTEQSILSALRRPMRRSLHSSLTKRREHVPAGQSERFGDSSFGAVTYP